MRLLFPCRSWKMDDAIFTFYTIPEVRAKSSSRLYWSRVDQVQKDCWQTSLIDHTFDCSSDYWQWSICARAQLHITSTTEFRLDCCFRVGHEKWLLLFLPSTQFPRKEKIIILSLLMESRVQTDCWQTSWIDVTFDCSSDYWQWSNCAHARLQFTLTTKFRLDCSFRVVHLKWMMLSLPSTQFPR
jgi:hypothetical protein